MRPSPSRSSFAAAGVARRASTLLRALGPATVILGLLAFGPSSARAHPRIDEGIRHGEEARFEAALASFAEALRGRDLERAELVSLLSHRAVVHFALRHMEALEEDLRSLAFLDPDHVLAPNVPPQVRERFASIRAETRAEASVASTGRFVEGGFAVSVSVSGIPRALLHTVRVNARGEGTTFRAARGREVVIPLPETSAVEWYVEILGPGGTPIARDGSASAPRRSVDPDALRAGNDALAEERNRPAWRWWAVGGGVAAAAVLTTVMVVVLPRSGGDESLVAGPVVR